MFNTPNFYPYSNFTPKPSLFSKLKTIGFAEFLTGTQKTLGVINQALPIVYQIKPLWNNAKTIFKINNIINEDNKKANTNQNNINNTNNLNNKNETVNNEEQFKSTNYNQPTFFI